MVMIIHDEFGNTFSSKGAMTEFYYQFDKTAAIFDEVYGKMIHMIPYERSGKIKDLLAVYDTVWDSDENKFTNKTKKNLQNMQEMIDKYQYYYPYSKSIKDFIAKNSGKLVSPRDKQRGIDIWDNDSKKVEWDDKEYRKKKSTKSKPKRKVVKKCKCK
jgi:hypothetical protein